MSKKIYVRDPNGEKIFEHKFRECGALFGVTYDKIDDPHIDSKRYNRIKRGKGSGRSNAGFEDELKRPYDGEIRSKIGNFPAEFKYNENGLEMQQKKSQERIDPVNGSFFVLRKVVLELERKIFRWQTIYSIEKIIDNKLTKIYITENLDDMVMWFLGERGEGASHISYYVSWLK